MIPLDSNYQHEHYLPLYDQMISIISIILKSQAIEYTPNSYYKKRMIYLIDIGIALRTTYQYTSDISIRSHIANNYCIKAILDIIKHKYNQTDTSSKIIDIIIPILIDHWSLYITHYLDQSKDSITIDEVIDILKDMLMLQQNYAIKIHIKQMYPILCQCIDINDSILRNNLKNLFLSIDINKLID